MAKLDPMCILPGPVLTEGPSLPAPILPAPTLCVVVPVLNERDNVAAMVARLRTALDGVAWEAVFVDDDSTDGTRDAVAAIGRDDGRIRLLHRIGRRGLASAFIEGVACSIAPYVAAIDGDLQHDEALLPRMLAVLQTEPVDIVVASRYVPGGDLGDWSRRRATLSSLASRVGRLVLRSDVADPMSGFFMLPRAVFDRAARRLSAIGFKVLLDLLASLPEPPRVRELPYRFRARVAGSSKLDAGVLLDFLLLLLDKLIGGLLPVRFVMFAAVGLLGLLAHMAVLRLGLVVAGLSFASAQAVATACAIAGNFTLNNRFTFRDRRLRGPALLRGLLVFGLVCGVGAAANLNVASLLLAEHQDWWRAGLAGAAMSLVWNYSVGSTLTWRVRTG